MINTIMKRYVNRTSLSLFFHSDDLVGINNGVQRKYGSITQNYFIYKMICEDGSPLIAVYLMFGRPRTIKMFNLNVIQYQDKMYNGVIPSVHSTHNYLLDFVGNMILYGTGESILSIPIPQSTIDATNLAILENRITRYSITNSDSITTKCQ